MISVAQADKIIAQSVVSFSNIKIQLKKAYGRTLREDVLADRDQPQTHRVRMDGIAIAFASWENGQRCFKIERTQKAGIPALTLKSPNACLEAMTGAVLPHGCDCVVPIEDIDINDNTAELKTDITLTSMQNIQSKGTDYKSGQLLLKKGEILSPQHIAVAAGVGKAEITVADDPKIAVIGTGDELIEINKSVEDHQVYRSNEYTVEAILKNNSFQNISRFHFPDKKAELKSSLKKLLQDFDILILSGGVSMGKFDFIPVILKELRVELLFHKIKQRPGKPFWCGKSSDNKPVFALPGNPVSTQICTYRYVLPYLQKAAGLMTTDPELVALAEPFEPKKNFTYFCPVTVSSNVNAQRIATMTTHQGSGDYASLTKAHGFVEFPAGKKLFPAGSIVKFLRW